MKTISINQLYVTNKELTELGYCLTKNDSGVLIYQKENDEIVFSLSDYIDIKVKTVLPNYDNCIINIVDSIRKFYGESPVYKTNEVLDKILCGKEYKHIAIMLLDGMGSYILRKNGLRSSVLTKNKLMDISAVFPPTTACAIPALSSGLLPRKTGWVGWSNYFEEINKQVVMFKNTDYFSGEKLDFNVNDKLPYKKFWDNFDTYSFELGPIWTLSSCPTFDVMCSKFLEEISKHDKTFCYMYWDNPDYTMHEHGSYSLISKNALNKLENTLNEFYEKMDEDTLIIVTADHGHIDCKAIYLSNFIDIISCLKRLPSNEGRCTFFSINENKKKRFVELFNTYFGSYFTLLTKEEFVNGRYLGYGDSYNQRLDSFIGDFVSIAKGHYYFNYNPNSFSDIDEEFLMKSHHAGMTANEMIVPLIILKK